MKQNIWAAVLVAMFAAGCSFTPVYSEGQKSTAASLAFDYEVPGNRLEQIILQTLQLSFPDVADAPTIQVSLRTVAARETMSQVSGVLSELTLTVTAVAVISRGSASEVTRIERSASTTYSRVSQVLVNESSMAAAEERAAKSVAESLRVAIMAMAPHLAGGVTH